MDGLQTMREAVAVVWAAGRIGKIAVTVTGCSVIAVVDGAFRNSARQR